MIPGGCFTALGLEPRESPVESSSPCLVSPLPSDLQSSDMHDAWIRRDWAGGLPASLCGGRGNEFIDSLSPECRAWCLCQWISAPPTKGGRRKSEGQSGPECQTHSSDWQAADILLQARRASCGGWLSQEEPVFLCHLSQHFLISLDFLFILETAIRRWGDQCQNRLSSITGHDKVGQQISCRSDNQVTDPILVCHVSR